jgi:hypothetical protein
MHQAFTDSPLPRTMSRPERPRESGRLTPVMFDFPDLLPKSGGVLQPPRGSGRLTPVMFDFPNPLPKSGSVLHPPQRLRRLTPVIFEDTPAYDALTVSASTPAFDALYPPLQASQPTAQSGTMVDNVKDPYSVLGIAEGAGEAE